MTKTHWIVLLAATIAVFASGVDGRVPDDAKPQQHFDATTRKVPQRSAPREKAPHETADLSNYQRSQGHPKRSTNEQADDVRRQDLSRPVRPTKLPTDGKNLKPRPLRSTTLHRAQTPSTGSVQHRSTNPATVGGPASSHASMAGIDGTRMGRQR